MNNHLSTCKASAPTHNIISELIREIGKRTNAIYGSGETTSAYLNMLYTTRELLPDKNIPTYSTVNTDELYNCIKNSSVVCGILGYNRQQEEGHAWALDGTMNIVNTVNCKEVYGIGRDDYTLKWSKTIGIDNYIHHNWGWNGNYNGYFILGIFDHMASRKDSPLSPVLNSRGGYSDVINYFVVSK